MHPFSYTQLRIVHNEKVRDAMEQAPTPGRTGSQFASQYSTASPKKHSRIHRLQAAYPDKSW